MTTTVLVAGARTPMGRLSGQLAGFTAAQLGGFAMAAALERAGLTGDDVDQVVMGQVLQAGNGQIPARQAAVNGGIPMSVPALTINKVCLSGLDAIVLADSLIRSGLARTIVAGGMESMTRAPHLLPSSRAGFKYGDVTMIDHLAFDGLHDAFTDQSMGLLTEQANDDEPLTRLEQDTFAARSHQRAAAAQAAGRFADEIVPIVAKTREGETVLDTDEGIRPDATAESLGTLRPAFRPDGTVTAGSASPISDGAAAVIVMDKDLAVERGLNWLAEIGPAGLVAGPDSTLQLQPSAAVRAACDRAGIDPTALDLVEINEAFAAVGIASARALGISEDIVNVNGGAIALGHPIGMSGARLALSAALELRRRGGGTAAVALCGGGGQGEALLLTV